MASRYRLLALTTLFVVAADQLTKLWIVGSIRLGQSRPVIPGLLSLTYVRNRGVAFGVFSERGLSALVFIAVALAALGLILYFIRQAGERERVLCAALSLIFAGAVGNLIDRLRVGEVIDFLDLYMGSYHWPAFNVADAAITVGGLLLAANLLRQGGEPPRGASRTGKRRPVDALND
jgi:signal peptidase II